MLLLILLGSVFIQKEHTFNQGVNEMEFKNNLLQLAKRAEKSKEHLSTEEATKTSVIMPFFKYLGYDVFNPQEFLPEFTADVGIKKGEKVDYAIMRDGEPLILIEAKPYDDCLERHASQLIRYFSTTSAKFAILTNGILYRFFTDLDNQNKMDESPFFEFNLLNFRDNDILELKKFRKEVFDISKVFDTAEELKYKNLVKSELNKQLENIDDEFLNYMLAKICPNKRKNQSVLDKFRPWVNQAFNDLILETMEERLKSMLVKKDEIIPENEIVTQTENKETDTTEDEIPPITEAELGVFFTICSILRNVVPSSRIYYRKNKSYLNILIDNKITNWIIRVFINKKTIEIRDIGNFQFENLNDLFEHQNEIINTALNFYKENR